MNIMLTSDWPSTASKVVCDFMRAKHPQPRIAWIPSTTASGQEHFPAAKEKFAANDFTRLEYFDIDEKLEVDQLARLADYDIIYLTGGNPIEFRRRILMAGLPVWLQQCLTMGCRIVAASGGSMQLTKNISLFRLLSVPLEQVIAERSEYEGLEMVRYEILPHLNRFDASFLELVRCYSERVRNEVLALADGAALLQVEGGSYKCHGQVIRFRDGIITEIGKAA